MTDAFEAIDYLAGSENRVRVLQALVDGPAERRELQDDLGVSQSTASRILADLVDRDWVTRSGRRYEATLVGSLVTEAFARLERTIAAAADLSDLVEWLPVGEAGLEVVDFASAEVVLPDRTDLFAPVRSVSRRLEAAAEVRGFASTMAKEAFEANWRAVTAGDQRFEMVVTPDIVAALHDDDELRPKLGDLVEADRATLRVLDGDVPYTVTLVDGTVRIGTVDDEGRPRALVDSDDERVRAWFEDRFNRFSREARELTREDIES